MTPHPQADILLAVAFGKKVQAITVGDPYDTWDDVSNPLEFIGDIGYELRIKPETLSINGHEVPCPVREPMEVGTEYWRVALEAPGLCAMKIWGEDQYDALYLERRIAHIRVSDCEKHAEALLSFTRSDKCAT